MDGTVYAIPLDTHPFVLYYNVDIARKAGLLNSAGDALVPLKGKEDFVDAVKAMKDAGGAQFGAVMSITADPSTAWRFFSMIYSGLAGRSSPTPGRRLPSTTRRCRRRSPSCRA